MLRTGLVYAPYIPIFTVKPLTKKQKKSQGLCCPKCKSNHYSSTYWAFIGRDENIVACLKCGWAGRTYQLAKAKKVRGET